MEEREQSTNGTMPTEYDPATIHRILTNRSREDILEMLQYKIDSSYASKDGDTVLHAILRNEKLIEIEVIEILNLFLIQGMSPNIKNKNEKITVLYLAVARRMKNAINLLLKFKANIHIVNDHGISVAHFFIQDEYKKYEQAMCDPDRNTEENREKMENESVNFLEFLMSKDVDFDRKNTQGDSALHLAIAYYLPHILPTLLEHTNDIMFIDKNNKTLLHLFLDGRASTRRSQLPNEHPCYSILAAEIVRILLERGVPLMADGYYGCTVVSDAIKEREEICIIETLINYYLNNCDDKNLATTLFHELMSTCALWSTSENDYFLTVLRDLAVQGVNVNNELSRKRFVLAALEARNVQLLGFLNENGVDLSFRLKHGKNLLHTLAEQKHYEELNNELYGNFCALLVCNDCEVNARDNRGKSALQMAAEHGNLLMARALIDFGAEINCQDTYMKTPLHDAVMMGESVELVELLLTSRADPNALDFMGEMPLHIAASRNNVSMARLLIEHGASVNCKDKNQLTPLDRALEKVDEAVEIVELLLMNGVDPNVSNFKGDMPLHIAASSNNVSIVRVLIEHGASVNCKDKNRQTPLHYAVQKMAETVELLLTSGADVNAKDLEGNRPLHRVFNGLTLGSERVLKMLLSKGAYVNEKNKRGESALFYALSRGETAMVAELLKYSADLNDSTLPAARKYIDNPPGNRQLTQFLSQYRTKLTAASLPFDKSYRAYMRFISDDQRYCSKCSEEIQKLKSTFIDNHKSLYDFLHMQPKLRGVYINHEKLQRLVESPKLDKQFPEYSSIILARYREASTRKSLLEQAKEAWYDLTDGRLPDTADQIFAYLANTDLISIIEANNYDYAV